MKTIPKILLSLALAAATMVAPTRAADRSEHVVLAGGCFWGMQAVFSSLRGVTKTVAGYSGGSADTATYDQVSTETTGHSESVDVWFDPNKISFQQLLDVYFTVAHDPTELDRQGPDTGSSYRSEIFYTTASQRAQAQAAIAALEHAHTFNAPIVTKVERLRGFYAAENYHQDFLVHNPDYPYIVYNDIPKLKALRAKFPQLVNTNSPTMRVL
jgi:peptide-methionine (S)-S-oxide reductase